MGYKWLFCNLFSRGARAGSATPAERLESMAMSRRDGGKKEAYDRACHLPSACSQDDGTVDESPTSGLEGLRILVAEDESLIALDLESMLLDLGCEVIGPVPDVDSILPKAKGAKVDAALLDVNLRGKQVFEVLPALLDLGIPVILTSGYDDETLFPEPFRHLPRISKPFGEAALKQTCIKLLGRRGTVG
jgi:CheY-like chemotaxis protein